MQNKQLNNEQNVNNNEDVLKQEPKVDYNAQDENVLNQIMSNFGDWFNEQKAPQMTQKLYPYTKMFSPIMVNRLKIKNRLVMGPMGNISMS